MNIYEQRRLNRVQHYLHDKEWDEGYHTSIKDFNARFDSFKILHPNNLVKLNQYKGIAA